MRTHSCRASGTHLQLSVTPAPAAGYRDNPHPGNPRRCPRERAEPAVTDSQGGCWTLPGHSANDSCFGAPGGWRPGDTGPRTRDHLPEFPPRRPLARRCKREETRLDPAAISHGFPRTGQDGSVVFKSGCAGVPCWRQATFPLLSGRSHCFPEEAPELLVQQLDLEFPLRTCSICQPNRLS